MRERSLVNLNLGIAALGSFIVLGVTSTTPASAQSSGSRGNWSKCPIEKDETSTQLREIRNQEFGFSFKVPANYRAETGKKTSPSPKALFSVSLVNPSEVRFAECAERNKLFGWGHAYQPVQVYVEVAPSGMSSIRNLPEIANSRNQQVIFRREISLSGQTGIVYGVQYLYPFVVIEAVVPTPDKRHFIKIRASDYGKGMSSVKSADKAVIETFISSFRFN